VTLDTVESLALANNAKTVLRRPLRVPDSRACSVRKGDILWTQETFRLADAGEVFYLSYPGDTALDAFRRRRDYKWSPSTQMKREQSRFSLLVKDAHVEPLWSILDRPEDVKREGLHVPMQDHGSLHDTARWVKDYFVPWWNGRFSRGLEDWMSNPLVVRAEFEVFTASVEEDDLSECLRSY